MVYFKLNARISGLTGEYRRITEDLLRKSKQYQDLAEVVISDELKKSFNEEYNRTPFKHATGNYYKHVSFPPPFHRRSKREMRSYTTIEATAPYSDCLEVGHQSFSGYHIIERTIDSMERKVPEILDRITRV